MVYLRFLWVTREQMIKVTYHLPDDGKSWDCKHESWLIVVNHVLCEILELQGPSGKTDVLLYTIHILALNSSKQKYSIRIDRTR